MSTSLDVEKKYRTLPMNAYQKLMREWYSDNPSAVTGNAFRKNTRDFPIFARMKQGDNYIDASAIAEQLFSRKALELGLYAGTEEYAWHGGPPITIQPSSPNLSLNVLASILVISPQICLSGRPYLHDRL